MATRQWLGDVEFTYDWYREFLDQLRAEGCEFLTFDQEPREDSLHLRHDVDLSLDDALKMARIEAEADVQATYCILLTSPLYNPLDRDNAATIREIDALGHDVGLHFNTHNYWDGETSPPAEAIERRVRQEQAALEIVTSDISATVSFHRPVPWVLGREFDGFQNTYAPAFFSETAYLADSNQRWRADPPKVPELPSPVQLLTHPGLWSESDANFDQRIEHSVISACRDVNRRAREEFIEPQREPAFEGDDL